MCVFTYDCFSYLLYTFYRSLSLKISQPLYSLSGFMNKDLTEERASPEAPLQGEERGVGVSLSGECLLVEGVFKACALLPCPAPRSKPWGCSAWLFRER